MERSNIFVLIEMTKLSESLSTDISITKQRLKSQISYFNIITSKYFSDNLYQEWQNIKKYMIQKGPVVDKKGKVLVSALINTIDQMSDVECVAITKKIMDLTEKIKMEHEYSVHAMHA